MLKSLSSPHGLPQCCYSPAELTAGKAQTSLRWRIKKQPIPVMRQVQIAAGILILVGVVLGYTLDKSLFLLSGLVGAGLIFAGISGWCGMAILLAKMPWNTLKR
jgi:hypothetical protein